MGVTIPKGFEGRKLFGVYRPATLLAAKKDLFAAQPFINTHKGFVNPENFTKWAQGWVGDTIVVEMNEAGTEAVIKGDLKILGAEAIAAYDGGDRQVSPHYFGAYDWEPGVAPDDTEYQVIARDLTMVNHVALVPRGRGGPDAAIQDNAPGPFSAIWAFIEKKFRKGVTDAEMPTFRQNLEEIAKLRESLSGEQLDAKAGVLYECLRKMQMSEDVDLLYRFLGDINLLSEGRTDEEAAEYVKTVADLYEKLEEQSLQEIMKAQEKDVKAQEDAMTEEEKKAGEAAAKDAENKEMDEFMTKVKDHVAGGGKVSDFQIGGKKAKDAEPEEKKPEDKKAEDEEAEEKPKEEKKAEAKDAAPEPSILGQYDGWPPVNHSLSSGVRTSGTKLAQKALERTGYFGTKEKK